MIEIRNLTKSFGRNQVLKGVELTVKKGETLAVLGRSGCGKTVLLKHMIGLLMPDEGEVIVDGLNVCEASRSEIYRMRMKFGMVFQGSALFDSMTVAENVGLGLTEHTRLGREEISRRVREKLSLVGLAGVEDLKPAELSGGMKKRAALARAIAMDPEYVLYDEPTTGSDPILADQINRMMLDLKQKLGIASVVVTHDVVSASKVADRIVMLHDGKITFEGTSQEWKKSEDPIVKEFIRWSLLTS